ncbi:MAG: glycosyltransferase [Bacilli bacterium]|nr:glycosyltransferase [Bacilli bacterium]
MRVVLFTDTYPPEINGVATSTYNLQKTMVTHGHDVLVIATNPFNDKLMVEEGIVRIPGIVLKNLYGYRFTKIFNSEVFEIIKKFKPDVFHLQTDLSVGQFGFLLSSRLNVPMVYTYHTMYEDYTYYATKGRFDRFAKNVVRYYLHFKAFTADEFIAPSDKIKNYLRSIGIDSHISVVPTGIEFEKFSPKHKDPNDVAILKKELGIEPDDYVILSLGRVAKEKSIDVCIRGYYDYLMTNPKHKTKMLVVGGGPALDELKELAASLGIADKVLFSGPCKPSETQRYYHLGDCFVSASVTETQGLTFMEAMASELVVLARYDDNLEGTIADGETGYFFFDESDFKQKLERIIELDEEKKQSIIKNAVEAIDIYSMEKFYQNAYEVYQRAEKKNW